MASRRPVHVCDLFPAIAVLSVFLVPLGLVAFADLRAGETRRAASERDDPFARRREEMVTGQLISRGIADPRVLAAMRSVPRHRFVRGSELSSAYEDRPLPIGHGQTISQPYIVALMTELLEVRPGARVLEIGTGSGYQAAVLAACGATVLSIEIVPELARSAAKTLEMLGYRNARVREGDGYFGWPEEAPFEGILVTCAADHIPPALLDQLAPGGSMCLPVGGRFTTQNLVLVEKDSSGVITTRNLLPVRFVPLTRKRDQGD